MFCIKSLLMTLDKIAQLFFLFVYSSIIHPIEESLRKTCNIFDIQKLE